MVAAAQGSTVTNGVLRATAAFTGSAQGNSVASGTLKNIGWTQEAGASGNWTGLSNPANTWTELEAGGSWTPASNPSDTWTKLNNSSASWAKKAA
jgi:hypothetical protein